ncbi:MAG: hypothetical protein P8Y80_06215 [Acidobacteriota bacterium]
MKWKLSLFIVCCAVVVTAMLMFSAGEADARGPRGSGPVIYVSSQDLLYDSIVGPELPPQGPFQLLTPGGPDGADLTTEFGPGDPGYVGGRWYFPGHDPEYFSCPLLGPGRPVVE